jgi:hypothetical protein
VRCSGNWCWAPDFVTARLGLSRTSWERSREFLTRPARVSLLLLILQLSLGVGAYAARVTSAGDPQPLEPMISLTAAHVVVGALTLSSVLLLTLRCYRVLTPAERPMAQIAEAGAAGLRTS